MGLFGLFMAGAYGAAKLGSDIQEHNKIAKRKKEAIEKHIPFYLDNHGQLVHAENDLPFARKWIDGDLWEVDPYSGVKRYNITKLQREKFIKENQDKAKANGTEWYCIKNNDFSEAANGRMDSSKWMRFGDNNVYWKEKHNSKTWFVNVKTGLLEDVDRTSIFKNSLWRLGDGIKNFRVIKPEEMEEAIKIEKEYTNNNLIKYGYAHI